MVLHQDAAPAMPGPESAPECSAQTKLILSVCPSEGQAIEVADFCFSKRHTSDGAFENVCRAHMKQSQDLGVLSPNLQ